MSLRSSTVLIKFKLEKSKESCDNNKNLPAASNLNFCILHICIKDSLQFYLPSATSSSLPHSLKDNEREETKEAKRKHFLLTLNLCCNLVKIRLMNMRKRTLRILWFRAKNERRMNKPVFFAPQRRSSIKAGAPQLATWMESSLTLSNDDEHDQMISIEKWAK